MRFDLTAGGRMWAVVLMSVLLVGMTVLFQPSPKDASNLIVSGKQRVHVIPSTHLTKIDQKERLRMRKMLEPAPAPQSDRFERTVWIRDMQQVIGRWISDDVEAGDVARWVYVYSRRFHISPELVLAVIAVESHFDRFAISHAGARGLMQVMPFWKRQLGSSNDNLFEIETNVRYGCAILRTYLNRYGTTTRALAAYNGSLKNDSYPGLVYGQMKRFKASAQDLQNRG